MIYYTIKISRRYRKDIIPNGHWITEFLKGLNPKKNQMEKKTAALLVTNGMNANRKLGFGENIAAKI